MDNESRLRKMFSKENLKYWLMAGVSSFTAACLAVGGAAERQNTMADQPDTQPKLATRVPPTAIPDWSRLTPSPESTRATAEDRALRGVVDETGILAYALNKLPLAIRGFRPEFTYVAVCHQDETISVESYIRLMEGYPINVAPGDKFAVAQSKQAAIDACLH